MNNNGENIFSKLAYSFPTLLR